jgi:hypothetical protein
VQIEQALLGGRTMATLQIVWLPRTEVRGSHLQRRYGVQWQA